MNDHKTFLEKWKDFWLFWFDPMDFLLSSIAVSILMASVSGSLALLRLVGLI